MKESQGAVAGEGSGVRMGPVVRGPQRSWDRTPGEWGWEVCVDGSERGCWELRWAARRP